MSNEDIRWQQFLEDHKDLINEVDDNNTDLDMTPKKEYGITLFSGGSDGYFMIFNTQIDIFQFTYLLHEFFGIDGVEVGHIDEDGFHNHSINDEFNDDDDDDG